jgi:FkbM family methyltransferase
MKVIFEKGLRFSTVIDLGSADGHFHLSSYSQGLLPGSIGVNIDANPIYEESLKAIKEVMGGYYLIAAVTDHVGDAELTAAAHPYWSSLRNEEDSYWSRLNQLHAGKIKVPAVTLDAVVDNLGLKPPFLLKLDIQGGEVAALKGAEKTLRDTDVIICEADVDDFHEINRVVEDAGFGLFDLTTLSYLPDQSLGWFYPVYLNRRLDVVRVRQMWAPANNQQIIQIQETRRKGIQEFIAGLLRRQRTKGPR